MLTSRRLWAPDGSVSSAKDNTNAFTGRSTNLGVENIFQAAVTLLVGHLSLKVDLTEVVVLMGEAKGRWNNLQSIACH